MVGLVEADVVAAPAGSPDRSHLPSHVPTGAALLAVELSEHARGVRGLDVLRRSVDRAPPAQS
jgi:hypothetical protein